MAEIKTHWKSLAQVDYIGAYALQPGEEKILTIKSCAKELVTGDKGAKKECLVVHFVEPDTKPMIVNRTNAKIITKLYKSPFIEDWPGKKIQIYAARVDAFGDTVDALRIRDFQPKNTELDVTAAIAKVNSSMALDELKANYTSLSKEEQGHSRVIEAKDKMKTVLTKAA